MLSRKSDDMIAVRSDDVQRLIVAVGKNVGVTFSAALGTAASGFAPAGSRSISSNSSSVGIRAPLKLRGGRATIR